MEIHVTIPDDQPFPTRYLVAYLLLGLACLGTPLLF